MNNQQKKMLDTILEIQLKMKLLQHKVPVLVAI